MEPVNFVVRKIKGLTKSGQDFVDGVFRRREDSSRRNPIEILKRLQREAFSDLMRLRDRQDKVEKVLSFYKTSSKGSPFQEANTHLRGEVDVLGAILLSCDLHNHDTLRRAGIRTGIESRFTFETTMRENDALLAEFVASQNGMRYYDDDVSGSALSLEKVSYKANISDWFSLIAIPVGAQSRDLRMIGRSSNQRKGLTDHSFVGPPLLNQYNGSTIGLTVRKSNAIASIGQSVSGLGLQPYISDGIGHCFSTFGQIACQLPRRIKLSLSGLHQVPKSPTYGANLGPLTIPLVFRKQEEAYEPLIDSNSPQTLATGSIALNLETELYENARIGGWIQMKHSDPKQLQWAVNMFDDSVDESGWGMCVSGMLEGSSNWAHLQVESYLKLNLGTKFSIKPGIAYVVDGDSKTLALMLRSNWSF